MTHFSFLLTFVIIASNAFAQKVKTIDPEDVCDIVTPRYHVSIKPVEEFKDSLTITLKVSTVSKGQDLDAKGLTFTEVISDESSIIRIGKEVGFSISIARVVEKGKNYYLYSLRLYSKEGNCWEEVNGSYATWSKFNLGTVTTGYASGSEGTRNYIGFTGSLSVE